MENSGEPPLADRLCGTFPGHDRAQTGRDQSGRAGQRPARYPDPPRGRSSRRVGFRQYRHHGDAASWRKDPARRAPGGTARTAAGPFGRSVADGRISVGAAGRKHVLQRDGDVWRRTRKMAGRIAGRAHLCAPEPDGAAEQAQPQPVLRPEMERRELRSALSAAVSETGHAANFSGGAFERRACLKLANQYARRAAALSSGGLSGNGAGACPGSGQGNGNAAERSVPGGAVRAGKSGGRLVFPFP